MTESEDISKNHTPDKLLSNENHVQKTEFHEKRPSKGPLNKKY